jgi:pyruvate dehydrogenase E2 component (dihydrolipoamide acetyltransferase)
MSETLDIVVPDIGDYKDVPIVEIFVNVGDSVAVDAPLVTVESEKATMEVPSPAAGTVREIKVRVGAKVSQGSPLMTFDLAGAQTASTPETNAVEAVAPAARARPPVAAAQATPDCGRGRRRFGKRACHAIRSRLCP